MTLDGTSNKEARLDPPAYPIRSCPLPLLSMVWQSLWNEMESQPPLPLFLFSGFLLGSSLRPFFVALLLQLLFKTSQVRIQSSDMFIHHFVGLYRQLHFIVAIFSTFLKSALDLCEELFAFARWQFSDFGYVFLA